MMFSAKEISDLREKIKLDQDDFAKLLGVDPRTVARWESGENKITGSAEAILVGIREKLKKDPESSAAVLSLIGGVLAVGGLAFFMLTLLDVATVAATVAADDIHKKDNKVDRVQ